MFETLVKQKGHRVQAYKAHYIQAVQSTPVTTNSSGMAGADRLVG